LCRDIKKRIWKYLLTLVLILLDSWIQLFSAILLLVFLFRTKALVLELLAAVCLVSGGHEKILSAFYNFKQVSNWYLALLIFSYSYFKIVQSEQSFYFMQDTDWLLFQIRVQQFYMKRRRISISVHSDFQWVLCFIFCCWGK
jgi:hypothetical protein